MLLPPFHHPLRPDSLLYSFPLLQSQFPIVLLNPSILYLIYFMARFLARIVSDPLSLPLRVSCLYTFIPYRLLFPYTF